MSTLPTALGGGDLERWNVTLAAVADACGVETIDLLLLGTDVDSTFARKVAAYVMHTHDVSFSEIGQVLGKHRSTVHEQVRRIAWLAAGTGDESDRMRALLARLPLGEEE